MSNINSLIRNRGKKKDQKGENAGVEQKENWANRNGCKPWCSSFQTSHFITKHQHNNLQKNNRNIFLNRCNGSTCDDIYYFSALPTEKGLNFVVKENIHVPFMENFWYTPVVSGPYNGLLCLHVADKVALWNPSTREFKILPQSNALLP